MISLLVGGSDEPEHLQLRHHPREARLLLGGDLLVLVLLTSHCKEGHFQSSGRRK